MERPNIKQRLTTGGAMQKCAKGDVIVTFSRFTRGECFHGYEGKIYSENGVCYGTPEEAKIILNRERFITDAIFNKDDYWFATYILSKDEQDDIANTHNELGDSYCIDTMMRYRAKLLPWFNPDINGVYCSSTFITDAERKIADPAYFKQVISDAHKNNSKSEEEVNKDSHKSDDDFELVFGHCTASMIISTAHLKQNKTVIVEEYSDNIFEMQILRDTEKMIRKALVIFEELTSAGKLMVTIKYLYPFNTSIHPTDLDNTSIHVEKMEVHWKFDDASPFGIKIKISDITREIIPNIGEVKDNCFQEYQKLINSTGKHLSINRMTDSANHVSVLKY